MSWLSRLRDRVTVAIGVGVHFDRIVRVAELPDVPDEFEPVVVYVAGSVDRPKWAVLLCPCNEPHRVTLSLQRIPDRPRWSVREEWGRPTIWPSIDVRAARRCHYWVRGGIVRWVPAWAERD